MAAKRDLAGWLLMAASMAAGGVAAAALAHRLVGGVGVLDLLPLLLGAAFGCLGWFLGENIGDAAFLLLLTGLVGAVAFTILQGETVRTLVIAFVCGFNIGKVIGAIYREYR